MVNAQEITDNTGRLGTESDRGANRANMDNKLTRRTNNRHLVRARKANKASRANKG